MLTFWGRKALIFGICRFPWYRFFHHHWFQATNGLKMADKILQYLTFGSCELSWASSTHQQCRWTFCIHPVLTKIPQVMGAEYCLSCSCSSIYYLFCVTTVFWLPMYLQNLSQCVAGFNVPTAKWAPSSRCNTEIKRSALSSHQAGFSSQSIFFFKSVKSFLKYWIN